MRENVGQDRILSSLDSGLECGNCTWARKMSKVDLDVLQVLNLLLNPTSTAFSLVMAPFSPARFTHLPSQRAEG